MAHLSAEIAQPCGSKTNSNGHPHWAATRGASQKETLRSVSPEEAVAGSAEPGPLAATPAWTVESESRALKSDDLISHKPGVLLGYLFRPYFFRSISSPSDRWSFKANGDSAQR